MLTFEHDQKYNQYYHNNEHEQVNMTENQKYNKYYHNDEQERVMATPILLQITATSN